MAELTHLDASGNARMVDVSAKPETSRFARAESTVVMQPQTLERITRGCVAKGDVLATARIAGIQAAKRCSELIPLCHPLALRAVEVELLPSASDRLRIEARCKVSGPTGVEMEALTAASVAALTVYDMCKAIDRGMTIDGTRLLEKSGGRSGLWRARQ